MTYRKVHDRQQEIRRMTDKELRLAFDEADAALRQSVEADELREHCRNLMAKYKIPRFLWISREPLPRNASGKFLRKEIQGRLVGAAGKTQLA